MTNCMITSYGKRPGWLQVDSCILKAAVIEPKVDNSSQDAFWVSRYGRLLPDKDCSSQGIE
jgi:hypothetical protein